ncbi:MAG: T9SS type A sorting domain-containing protein, partial [Flavobacteriales bacterium]
LYSSYKTAVSGSHQKLFINAVLWLSGTTSFAAPQQSTASPAMRSSLNNEPWSVYPNPVSDRLIVEHGADSRTFALRFFDLTGRMVYSCERFSQEGRLVIDLDRSVLNRGVYLLLLQTCDEQRMVRLIVD